MDFEVLGFGKIAGITGSSIRVNGVTDTDSLRAKLEDSFPLLKETKYVLAVDKQMTTGNLLLKEGSVIALLPPFSGG